MRAWLRWVGLLVAGLVGWVAPGWAEEWRVVWKDEMQQIRVDRDSMRVEGGEVEYWYSDEMDAIVDWMEHRLHAISDCANHRMRRLAVYDPSTGVTTPIKESGWEEMPSLPNDPMSVLHDEVCREAGLVGSVLTR